MSFSDNVKGFIVKPKETFIACRDESFAKSYQYYVILLIMFTVLYGIVTILTGMNSFAEATALMGDVFGPGYGDAVSAFGGFATALDIFFIYLMFVFGLFTIFISGFMLHCFVLMFGGEKGYRPTLKSMFYAYTPYLLLGWIPIVNIIALIWTLVLQIIGISVYHEISMNKAILIVLLPIILTIIGVLLFGVVIASFLSGLMSLGGISV